MIKLILATFLAWTSAQAVPVYTTCDKDQVKQEARSKELQEIYAADQADRHPPYPPDISFRDRARRIRVGQIFGEGCINTPKDYNAAAIVFQHGDRPDHFFQTFIFSKRAVELGDVMQKRNMALGIDRYLVNTNHRQLFASQAHKAYNEPCFCLEPVEVSFPESVRKEFMGATLKEQFAWVDTLNKEAACAPAKECSHPLLPTPKGTVPGFW